MDLEETNKDPSILSSYSALRQATMEPIPEVSPRPSDDVVKEHETLRRSSNHASEPTTMEDVPAQRTLSGSVDGPPVLPDRAGASNPSTSFRSSKSSSPLSDSNIASKADSEHVVPPQCSQFLLAPDADPESLSRTGTPLPKGSSQELKPFPLSETEPAFRKPSLITRIKSPFKHKSEDIEDGVKDAGSGVSTPPARVAIMQPTSRAATAPLSS